MQAISKQPKAQQQIVSQKQLSNIQNTKRSKSVTFPAVQIELIRPGKQRVKIPINVVENTPSRRMQAVLDTREFK